MTALTLNLNKKQQLNALKIITHIGSLLPLALLYFDWYTFNLGTDEIRELILRTGKPALYLLIGSLAITPLNILFGWKLLLPLRKPLGLYSFLYVVLHLLIFAVSYGYIDFSFDWNAIWQEIVFRRYALLGFASFLILLPLALTSTKWAMRKLGKRWKPLHRWVYLAAILAVAHYIYVWLSKNIYLEPAIYAAILAIFLILRFNAIKNWVTQTRKQISKNRRERAKVSAT